MDFAYDAGRKTSIITGDCLPSLLSSRISFWFGIRGRVPRQIAFFFLLSVYRLGRTTTLLFGNRNNPISSCLCYLYLCLILVSVVELVLK